MHTLLAPAAATAPSKASPRTTPAGTLVVGPTAHTGFEEFYAAHFRPLTIQLRLHR